MAFRDVRMRGFRSRAGVAEVVAWVDRWDAPLPAEEELTLAETGRVLNEHEATVSRQLARTRRAIRQDVERRLRDDAGLNDAQIEECFASAAEDAGPIDLDRIFASAAGRKEPAPDRSR